MKRMLTRIMVGLLAFFLCSACQPSDDAGGKTAGEVELDQLTNTTTPSLVRTDNKKFSADDFAARTIPVDVTFAGPVEPEVRFDGALAEPNFEEQGGATMNLRIYLVLYLPGDSLLTQGPDSIYFSSYKMKWAVELYDAGGNLLQTNQINHSSSLQPAFLHAFDAYLPAIPAATATAKVAVEFADELRMGASCVEPDPNLFCAEASDVGKRAPDAILAVSPVHLRIEKDNWNETYARDSALGRVNFQFSNPYSIDLPSPIITLLFVDANGELAGFLRIEYPVGPGETQGRTGTDYYTTSYFSAIPTAVQAYTWVTVSNVIEALR